MTLSVARRAGKTVYGLLVGRQRRHWFDIWPGLTLERDSLGSWARVLYRGQLAAELLPCRSLTDRKFESIAVVGAGPSLRNQAHDRLSDYDIILTNGSLALIGDKHIHPAAVFIEDEGFVVNCPELVVAIPDGTHCFFSPPVLRAICAIDPAHLGRWRVSLAEVLHRPVGSRRPDWGELASRHFVIVSGGNVLFSSDCDRGFGSCGTVVYCALQLAVQCAPRSIGLAGVDLMNLEQPRVHEVPGQRRPPSRLQRRLPSILQGFSLAAKVCHKRGIATVNYSAASLVPAAEFPYNDLLDRPRAPAG